MDYTTSMGGKMIVFAVLPVLILLQVPHVEAGKKCPYGYSYYSTSSNWRWCDDGCCGTKYSDYSNVCCYEINVDVNGGLIAGSAVGGLAGLAIVIGVIVCCCVAASRSGRSPGTVIQPVHTNAQTLVLSNTAFTQEPPAYPGPNRPAGYPAGVAPPAYVQYDNVPEQFGNPAYPPPPASKY